MMKKQGAIGALLLISILAFQQPVWAQAFHGGIKGGANLGKIDGIEFKDKYKLGYHLGGFMEIDLGRVIGIQPEVLFNQANAKVKGRTSDVFRMGDDIKLNYLSIPVLLRVNAGNYFTLHAGPQYSILLNNQKTVLANARNAFKSGDFAMVFGLQLNIKLLRIY